ncbi:hypothetical protein HZS38_15640 [Xenorhabdus nematophila]|uniref:hypothetical protein n=2 Tax=Xenorhabdus nematophila TaxID=628 RepID=UPI0005A918F4|nr:hypothetical protein [Xenorhabdus nematophila]AYA41768.1 hypothetical protein D3790_16135 [Xenorhabdus nematophila]MBA0020501.1 hypothetical protein [Xenorhabdus nematophila]MCB4425902.1 hypothetical protein [Xenorhabdus nematophila]QNJ36146.1 hypothetical protein H8F46_15780 [Xenorhabdus nematophila]
MDWNGPGPVTGTGIVFLDKAGKVTVFSHHSSYPIPYSASPIVDMASNKHNFLLKNKNGSIVDSSVSNAAHVACAADSYAALIKNGTVETWGNTYGSWTNNNQGGQKAIYATGRAFASLTDNDNIILWGEGSGGGSDPFITSALAGKISYYRK